MDNFELPTNVRQIGSIDTSGLRIYVEDYVFTFVHQYTQANSGIEKLGVLVGRYIETESGPILFISGAIEGKYAIQGVNGIGFSKKTMDHADAILDKYFPGLEVVGWLQSQPGYGTYLSSKNDNYHKENFPSKFQVLFVTDPVQRMDAFYMYDEEGELCESKGYFVYYDKNKPMHEYMIDNRIKSSAATAVDRLAFEKAQEPEEEEDIQSLPVSKRRIRELREATEEPARRRTTTYLTKEKRQPAAVSTRPNDQKRLVNMLTALCAVMFLISFVMGAGLIRSDERINTLEQNIAALTEAHRYFAASVATGAAVPAFASEVMAEIGLLVTEEGNRLLAEENARAIAETPGLAADRPAETTFAPTAPEPPPAAVVTPPTSIPDTYIVQAGDSLLGISQRIYGTTAMVERIMEANAIDDADRIFLGQVLIMPQP